ncbi:uncharacterized protein LOC111287907 isoform X3 [Durio zibethinus]|uniref:Uncharacterized protein LOC111287907 isoform X3 n=1 Tax=Durio zibethinus TaxID=66656 RepID=A0A6P5Y2V0_DURZI|nr:uncharacterized protein LOC111287907 isoform X3 [Durio zibethinus]
MLKIFKLKAKISEDLNSQIIFCLALLYLYIRLKEDILMMVKASRIGMFSAIFQGTLNKMKMEMLEMMITICSWKIRDCSFSWGKCISVFDFMGQNSTNYVPQNQNFI